MTEFKASDIRKIFEPIRTICDPQHQQAVCALDGSSSGSTPAPSLRISGWVMCSRLQPPCRRSATTGEGRTRPRAQIRAKRPTPSDPRKVPSRLRSSPRATSSGQSAQSVLRRQPQVQTSQISAVASQKQTSLTW